MIKISIIVPVYNVEQYLPRCLDSLMSQSLQDIEVICVNDGSPDKCAFILADYEKKFPDKIVVINKKNEGVWKGRRDGIRIARGEYIGFVDSDDYVTHDYAETLYNAARNRRSDICVCGFERVDMETGKVYSREMCKDDKLSIDLEQNPELIVEINGAPWNKIYRSEILKNLDDLSSPPKIFDDLMFQLLAYLNARTISFVNSSLIYYMIRSDSIMTTIKAEQIEPTYQSMLEIRNIYKIKASTKLRETLDTIAFLHLGISLMFRIYNTKGTDFYTINKRNRQYLNDNFPKWRSSKYLTFSYGVQHKFSNIKLWIVSKFYKANKLDWFLKTYSGFIRMTGIDIKW